MITEILLLDTETSGLDPVKDFLLEVAVARYSLQHATIVDLWSKLIDVDFPIGTPPFPICDIPAGALYMGSSFTDADKRVLADGLVFPIVAWNAEFDRKWFSAPTQANRWLCAMNDIEWPRANGKRSLNEVAINHHVGVARAHRAIDDVLTMAALLTRCAELGHDLVAMVAKAMRPKKRYVANVSYATNQLAKDAGFRWEPSNKTWWKDIAAEDVPVLSLPFEIRESA